MKTNKPLTASSPSNSDGGFTSIRVLKAIVAVLLVAAIPFVLLRASEQQTYDASFDGTNADLIGWWRFDETSGSTVEDYSGNGNSAEIRTTQHVTRVPFTSAGGAMYYDGIIDPLDMAFDGHVVSEGLASHTLSNAFTVAAWVRLDSFTAYAPILSKMTNPDTWDDGFALYALGSGSFGACVGSFADPANHIDATANTAPSATNEWHHLCLVYDGSVSVLYLDGVAVADTIHASGSVANAAPLVIGSIVGTAATRPWHGDIAEVRIYSSAFADAEIEWLYETSADADGFDTLQEESQDTDPLDASTDGSPLDSDGDGMSDEDEIRLGRNPFAAGTTTPSVSILHVHTPME